jgi:hypothetical protein
VNSYVPDDQIVKNVGNRDRGVSILVFVNITTCVGNVRGIVWIVGIKLKFLKVFFVLLKRSYSFRFVNKPKAFLVRTCFDRAPHPKHQCTSFYSIVDTVSDVVKLVLKSFVEDLVQRYELRSGENRHRKAVVVVMICQRNVNSSKYPDSKICQLTVTCWKPSLYVGTRSSSSAHK